MKVPEGLILLAVGSVWAQAWAFGLRRWQLRRRGRSMDESDTHKDREVPPSKGRVSMRRSLGLFVASCGPLEQWRVGTAQQCPGTDGKGTSSLP